MVTMLAVLALTSCDANKEVTSTTATEPPPPPPTRSATTPPAPPVSDPLDAGDFESDPCTSLTEDQQREFGVTGVERTTLTATEGESCFFVRKPTSDNLLVAFASKISNGLSYRYMERARGSWTYWQPTEVDGYPAVAYGGTEPPSCFFAVGISDSLHFWVAGSKDDTTCTESRTVASTILANIKAAN